MPPVYAAARAERQERQVPVFRVVGATYSLSRFPKRLCVLGPGEQAPTTHRAVCGLRHTQPAREGAADVVFPCLLSFLCFSPMTPHAPSNSHWNLGLRCHVAASSFASDFDLGFTVPTFPLYKIQF
jgi:hypothetical protein